MNKKPDLLDRMLMFEETHPRLIGAIIVILATITFIEIFSVLGGR